MSEVNILRLTTGEELIAKIESNTDTQYSLSDVMIIIPTRENSIGLVPFMPYSNCQQEGLQVNKSNVMFILSPHKDLLSRYNEITSNIITQDKELITP